MSNTGQKVHCGRWKIVAVAAITILGISGRENIFAQADKEREAEQTLHDLMVDISGEPIGPNVPMPQVYKLPPKIEKQTVGGTEEYKLFYFCRYQKSDDLQKIIQHPSLQKEVNWR